MNKIGYAIFGTPRGIEVISNGLFKELNLDSLLYLDTTAHLNLDKNETVLLIRRVPTSLDNLQKKDGILIALYEYATQYGEGSRTGFIGSSICFKDNIPNSDKLIQGLFFLFNKMKLNVDENQKLKSDSTQWDKSFLPDPNSEFGLFANQKLAYTPLSNQTENLVVKLSNLSTDSIGLLTHVCLNFSYHNINHLYASSQESVLNKLIKNGLKPVNYLDIFNYNPSIEIINTKLQSLVNQITNSNKELSNKETEIRNKEIEFRNKNTEISNTIDTLNTNANIIANRIKTLKAEEDKTKEELAKIDNSAFRANKELNELKNKVQAVKPKEINDEKLAADAVEAIFKIASDSDKKAVNEQFGKMVNSYQKNKGIIDYFIKKKNKLNYFLIILFSSAIFFSILLTGLLTWYVTKKYTTKKVKQRYSETKSIEQEITSTSSVNIIDESNKDLETLKNFSSDKDNLAEHQKLVFKVLNNIKEGKLTKDAPLYQYTIIHQWQYWELFADGKIQISLLKEVYKKSFRDISNLNDSDINFIVTNTIQDSKKRFSDNEYILKYLEQRNLNMFFLLINNGDEIKTDKLSFKETNEGLKKYKGWTNDLFKDVPSNIESDNEISLAYFEWLTKEFNQLDEIPLPAKDINLPWIKKGK